MRPMRPIAIALALAIAAVTAASAQSGDAAKPPARPWTDVAELSYVSTSGNASTQNFAFSNKFLYKWTRSDLGVDAAGLRAESTDRTITNPDGTVVVNDVTKTTAEAYALSAKYRLDVTKRLLWYVNGGWNRNTFQGFDNRYSLGSGVGYKFLTTPRHTLSGELGAEGVREERVDLTTDTYGALRAFAGYEFKINDSAKFTQEIELIDNLKDTADWRGRSVTGVIASMTKKVALKVSYTVLYRNRPVAVMIPPDATAPIGTPGALYTYEKTDTIAAASVVVNF